MCMLVWLVLSDQCVDCAVNLGALLLHALFEHWPSTRPQQESKNTDKGLDKYTTHTHHTHTHTYTHTHAVPLAPSPPPPPQLEELLEICAGCEASMWEPLATALTIPGEEVERLRNTHPNKPELCLEDLFKVG